MKNKTLTIDCATWQCGGYSDSPKNRLGLGLTALLNNKGFMCCLGQMSLQLNKKLSKGDIVNNGEPCECGKAIPHLVRSNGMNTVLSEEAMGINDDADTTVKTKIRLLRALFKKKNITLRFINQKVLK